MNLNIRTQVTIGDDSENGIFVGVVSTREVSSFVWDITQTLHVTGSFTQERTSQTSVIFKPNPGYSAQDLFQLIFPSAYIATVWKQSVTEFIKKVLAYHLGELLLVVSNETNCDYKPSFGDLNFVACKWLLKQMDQQIKDSLPNVKTALDIASAKSDLSHAKSTLNYLQFLKPGSTFLDDDDIKATINVLKTKWIPSLGKRLTSLNLLQESLKRLELCFSMKLSKFQLDELQAQIGQVTLEYLINQFDKFLNTDIKKYNKDVLEIVAQQPSKEEFESMMEQIDLMSPPGN